MEALVTLDVRRLPALCRRMRFSQQLVARRAGVRPDDLSRFFSAVAQGGLLDRVVEAVTALAAESEAAGRQ